jgi:RNA polymerase sigma-70 factor (ECF subfamily)
VRTRLFRARQLLRRDLALKMAGSMDSVFPFLGARCARITGRVLARL